MLRNDQTVKLSSRDVPEAEEAYQLLEANGGRITLFSPFGHNPLKGHLELIDKRESLFHARFPDFAPFVSNVVNGNYALFREGLLYFINNLKLSYKTIINH